MKALMKRLTLAVLTLIIIFGFWALYQMESHSDGVPVLNYHQINDQDQNALTVSTEQFRKQMLYLKENGYHAVTPEEMVAAWQGGEPLPEKPVIITFDDGYKDNYQNAYPILKEYGLRGTIFIITDYVGTYPKYLTWDMTDEMQKSGVMNIESHTLSHAELNKITPDELTNQLTGSKLALDWHLQKKAQFVAYPCGAFNEEIERATKEAGYIGAFTVHYGLADPDDQPYLLDRVPIFGCNSHTFERFKLRLEFAPIFGPLDTLARSLRADGHNILASFILVP